MYKLDFHFPQKEMAQSIPSRPINPPCYLVSPGGGENLCLGVGHLSIFHLRWLPRVFTNNLSYLAYDTEGNRVPLSLRFGSRNSLLSLPI